MGQRVARVVMSVDTRTGDVVTTSARAYRFVWRRRPMSTRRSRMVLFDVEWTFLVSHLPVLFVLFKFSLAFRNTAVLRYTWIMLKIEFANVCVLNTAIQLERNVRCKQAKIRKWQCAACVGRQRLLLWISQGIEIPMIRSALWCRIYR